MRGIANVLFVLACLFGGLAHAQGNPLAPTLVIEYHNTVLDHYFLSTPGEAEIIDGGGAGPGWQRTGYTFLVEPVAYHPNGQPLCRFYGSISPGPNSHFFTLDSTECELLKQIQSQTPSDRPRWNFEGTTFPAAAATNGRCENFYYRTPVYRLYNNGFGTGIDSNHRYTTKTDIVEAMKGLGWAFEGVAFCALS